MGYPKREKAPCLGCIEREEAAYLADVNKRVQKARNRRRKSRI